VQACDIIGKTRNGPEKAKHGAGLGKRRSWETADLSVAIRYWEIFQNK